MEYASKPRLESRLAWPSKLILFLHCHFATTKPLDLTEGTHPVAACAIANPASKSQLLTILHQEIIQRVDKGERASAAEIAPDVIQVQCPHHGPPKMLSFYENCLKKKGVVSEPTVLTILQTVQWQNQMDSQKAIQQDGQPHSLSLNLALLFISYGILKKVT